MLRHLSMQKEHLRTDRRCSKSPFPSDLKKSNSCLDESLCTIPTRVLLRESTDYLYMNKMRNLHNFMEEKLGKKSLCLLQEWESLEINDSDYRNHHRFTLRCLSKDLIPVSVKLKSTVNTRTAKQILHKAERQLLQDRIQGINGILQDNTVKLHRCRSRMTSLVTSTTMEKCSNFLKKVRESRFIKVRDTQVNKCNRLIGNLPHNP